MLLLKNDDSNQKKDWFGYILNYKAQWVAHKYKQEEKYNYVKIFVAVVYLISYKCHFVIRVKYNY